MSVCSSKHTCIGRTELSQDLLVKRHSQIRSVGSGYLTYAVFACLFISAETDFPLQETSYPGVQLLKSLFLFLLCYQERKESSVGSWELLNFNPKLNDDLSLLWIMPSFWFKEYQIVTFWLKLFKLQKWPIAMKTWLLINMNCPHPSTASWSESHTLPAEALPSALWYALGMPDTQWVEPDYAGWKICRIPYLLVIRVWTSS